MRSESPVNEVKGQNAKPARFARPLETLAGFDPASASVALATSSDIALILDRDGVILDVAFGTPELAREMHRNWIGARWIDTVTIESRAKIAELVREATAEPSRWRQVNYHVDGGPDVPVRFAVVRFGADGRILAVGRELRAMAALQIRLAEAQQAMEREYARIRSAEKRYRLLFQMSNEPVLIVDASTLRVQEANPAAAALLGKDMKRATGASFADLFDEASRQAQQSFVAALRVAPRVDNVHVRLATSLEAVLLSGSLFRQDNSTYLLVLLTRLDGERAVLSAERSSLLQAVERIPDAFAVTDHNGVILAANAAFVDLVQAATLEQIRGESLERWVGRPGVDLDILFGNLRSHGSVRKFSTILRSEFSGSEDIEITGVDVPGGPQACFGFSFRVVTPQAGAAREKLGGRELPRTAEQFTELVGRVPLKSLVRETTDLIERLCIEAALQLTQDNRASAADMLGLSRQGFYAKLRRYGLGDLNGYADKDES